MYWGDSLVEGEDDEWNHKSLAVINGSMPFGRWLSTESCTSDTWLQRHWLSFLPYYSYLYREQPCNIHSGTLQRNGGCAYCPVIWRKHLHPEKGQACWVLSAVGPGPLDLIFSSYSPIHCLLRCHLVPPLQLLEINSQGWTLFWWTFSQYICTSD